MIGPTLLLRRALPRYSLLAKAPFLQPQRGLLSSLSGSFGSGSGSSSRPLELKYLEGNGALALALPLPLHDNGMLGGAEGDVGLGMRVFSMQPTTSVGGFIAQVQQEDTSAKDVQVRTTKGVAFPPETPFSTLMADDFQIVLNDKVLKVAAPVFTGDAYTSLPQDGQLDIRSVAHKAAIIKLRETIESHPKWKIDVAEFRKLAAEHGIPKKQASQVLHAFHQVGIVFHFAQSPDEELKTAVFLKPRNVLDTYFDSLGLTPPTTQHYTEARQALETELATLMPEHDALLHLKKELDHMAHKRVRVYCYLSSLGLVGSFGLYAWLSFIHFSWDIMEPVTYFTGFGVSIVGYTWWTFTQKEYDYENIYDYLFQGRRKKLYARAAFDEAKLEALQARVAAIQKDIDVIAAKAVKPTCLQAQFLRNE
ncbi:hypothetical protein SPRG_08845 [Saprolegnia parasitica CBS 223.65]|uniref:Calcium uniporter protein C-terminal domain-containing protein n=1 Tax=Saprolegnia parasitica (strain CBS 223.65) TaxID=695850 RepID=A0A067C545_SAPPC|nr:hypothetical protein SPRG_08845 [Saprolegnia parasitica CBS 223.65]KDO25904.1 hypothetical protein SPRG_08845 [Saprolegnia parasitica CBS 223.65]|eukprot:XP_012203464.1 hypothetical protein SPRG_08845 [Saprolegnia parasitica CBS 223.65]